MKQTAAVFVVLLLCGSMTPTHAFWKELFAGAAAVAVAPFVLPALGFTAAGVTAGSMAAGMMSTLGTSGVVIPVLQSAGAAGLSVATKALVGAGAAAVARAATSEEEECH